MALLVDEPAVHRGGDAVVVVGGGDRLGDLHTLLSQALADAAPGAAADFLFLDAKGNARAAGRAVVRRDDVLLVVPASVAPGFAAALEQYRFLLAVDVALPGPGLAVARVRGAGTVELPGAPDEAMTAAFDGDGTLVRDRSGGVDLVGPPEWLDARIAALDLPPADDAAYAAWRIAAGEPAWDAEIRPGRRAQELGLLPTHVHLRKGCYPGQESIAKIHNLGRPRRALAVVELAGRVVPGDPVAAGGKVGEVTSAAPLGAAWVALALLPVGADGSVLGDGSVTAGDATGRVRFRVGEGLAQPGA